MEEKNYKKYIVFLLPVVILLIVLLFTHSSFANPELTKDIYLLSAESNYMNNENNSWRLKKSAKWINDHEAEIEINVRSKPFDSNAHDYIFMLDLTGENNLYLAEDFYRNYLYLPFGNIINKVTIIGYSENPSYSFLEKGINQESVENAFNSIYGSNHLTHGENVDYYDALLNLENVLSRYGAQQDEIIKVIFVGKPYDGLTPNNQEEEFDYIQETFPNVEFYFANTGDITTTGFLNKKVDYIGNDIELLTAANVIDEFVVTDYINTKYFEYEEVIENSYKFLAYVNCIPYDSSPKGGSTKSFKFSPLPGNNCYCVDDDGGEGKSSTKAIDDNSTNEPCGEMTLEYQMNNLEVDEETGKVTWDLSNSIYSTNATLKLKVKLKDEYRDSDEIFTTNTGTEVDSSLNGIDESRETNDSPELKLFYKITYNGNMPEGCYFEPVVEKHKVFSLVDVLEAPSCDGHNFKGWLTQIANINDLLDMEHYYESEASQFISYEQWVEYMMEEYNDGYKYLSSPFEMPDSDIVAKGSWGKPNVDKHFEGDKYGNYRIYSITQKSLVNATEIETPFTSSKSTIIQLSLDSLDAVAEYEVTAVNLSDVNYRIDIDNINAGNSNVDYEIVESPVGLSANSYTKFTIRIKYKDSVEVLPDNTNISTQIIYKFRRDGAMFKSGISVNNKIKRFINENSDFYTTDDVITRIVRYNGTPDSSYLISDNLVSIVTNEFQDPIYMWYDDENTTVYWYSPSAHVYYNYNASRFYSGLSNLSSTDSINEISAIYTTDMSYMFYLVGWDSENFTLDLGDEFDTSSVTDMSHMFSHTGYGNTTFTLDLGDNFDTSNVINMECMFDNTGYNSRVFTLDLGDKFDTSKVTNMSYMFRSLGLYSRVLTLDLGDKFNTSNVKNMSSMFDSVGYNSRVFTLDLGDKFDTSNVTSMEGMFNKVAYNSPNFTELDLGDKFDTSNVTNMDNMFYSVGYNSPNFTELDLGDKFNTSNVTTMNYMFYSCKYLTTIYAPTTFDTTRATGIYSLFYNDSQLVGEKGTAYSSLNTNASYAHIDGGQSNPGYFTSREELTVSMFKPGKVVNRRMKAFISSSADYSAQDSTITKILRYTNTPDSNVLSDKNSIVSLHFSKYPIYMWYDSQTTTIYWYCEDENVYYNKDASWFYSNLLSLSEISNASDIGTTYTNNMSSMFSNAGYNSPSFTLYLGDNFDTSNVTNMSDMFYYTGYKSTVFTLDLGNKFITDTVENMSGMFYAAGYNSTVFTLNLGNNFNTNKVTNMRCMFENAGFKSTIIALDLGDEFNTSNVTDMGLMFTNVGWSNPSFTLDLGDKFDTSNVTDMSGMFSNTGRSSTIFTLDLGDKFDTSNVTNMNSMFMNVGYSSTIFSLNLGDKFDTSKVTNMGGMFSGVGQGNSNFKILDLGSKFDTSKVTTMYEMFATSRYLTTIKVPILFSTGAVTNSNSMFYDCVRLVGGAGTTHNATRVDATYAHIDGGPSNPGYFTARS